MDQEGCRGKTGAEEEMGEEDAHPVAYEGSPGTRSSSDVSESLKNLPRKVRKKMKKKLKRKMHRQAIAKEISARESDPAFIEAQADEEAKMKVKQEEEAAEHRRQQEMWEEEERRAQKTFEERLAKEEQERRQREQREAEQQRRREAKKQELLERMQMLTEPLHYGPSGNDGDNNCSYYMKTGACRYGTHCKRRHPIPARSTTILIRNMYDGLGVVGHYVGDEDMDEGLEHDEDKLMDDYKEFYYDVEPECRQFGEVCRNRGHHLRGNLYVQFRNVDDAEKAARAMHERYYGGKQIYVQFSPVTSWRSAVCGQYMQGKCNRGSECNFLHPFRNPGNAYALDRDFWRPRERRDQRERSASRDRDRDKDEHGRREPTRWDRHRSRSRGRDERTHDGEGRRRGNRSTCDQSRSSRSRDRSESHHRPRNRNERGSEDRRKRSRSVERDSKRKKKRRTGEDGKEAVEGENEATATRRTTPVDDDEELMKKEKKRDRKATEEKEKRRSRDSRKREKERRGEKRRHHKAGKRQRKHEPGKEKLGDTEMSAPTASVTGLRDEEDIQVEPSTNE